MTEAALRSIHPELHGPYLKIKRASEHINDVHRQMHEFFDNAEVYSFVQQFDIRTRMESVYCIANKPMPPMWPVIVGEACFNLHSSLDQIFVALVARHTKGDPGKVYFPVCDSRQRFIELINKKVKSPVSGQKIPWTCQISPAAFRKIVKIAPYRSDQSNGRGNDLLWQLKALRNHDGHNFLIPTLAVSNRIVGKVGEMCFETWGFSTPKTDWLKIGINIGSASSLGIKFVDGQPHPEPEIDTAGKIGFGNVAGLEGKRVLTTLKAIAKECYRIFLEIHEVFE